MTTLPWYTTRESVKAALDVKLTARSDVQIDQAIASASRSVEGQLKRTFYPHHATKYLPWPDRDFGAWWRIWLDEHELVSLDSLVSGGVTINMGTVLLEPVNIGPPYSRIEVNTASSSVFYTTSTRQRNIAITGTFGYDNNTEPAGQLAGNMTPTTTSVAVTDSAAIGVGDLITVDVERMMVTNKTMITTTQTLLTPVSNTITDVMIAVTDTTKFSVGETLLIDAERMYIVDIAGSNLIVKRAWDGTTLAAHTGSTIYAPRQLTVERGSTGTTADNHSSTGTITRQVYPSLVTELADAEAITTVLQRLAGYARTVGVGENQREASGRSLKVVRDQALAKYGRKARTWAV